MYILIAGIALMGLVTGFLTGASATPIIYLVLPLLFALLSAGGSFYIVWGQNGKDQNSSKAIRRERSLFLGTQMIAFAPLFLLGIWLGVYAKFRADVFWPEPVGVSASFAFAEFTGSTPGVFHYLRTLDLTLTRDGVPIEMRKKVLRSLYESHEKWSDQAESLRQVLEASWANEQNLHQTKVPVANEQQSFVPKG